MASNPERSSLELCRYFRKNPTEAEALMWESLRAKHLDGHKFRRQHPMMGFILDFYCPELRLGIEIDGHIHLDGKQAAYDKERTKILQESGISILRFCNSEVLDNLPVVINRILLFINNSRLST